MFEDNFIKLIDIAKYFLLRCTLNIKKSVLLLKLTY